MVFSSLNQYYDNHMCLYISTVFLGERCEPWASCVGTWPIFWLCHLTNFLKIFTLDILSKNEILELLYCTLSFLVTGSFYWYQSICPCEFDHLWNWSLLRAFLFHKHILFHILHGFTIYMVIWWDCKSFLCPGKLKIVHNMKIGIECFFVSLLYFSVIFRCEFSKQRNTLDSITCCNLSRAWSSKSLFLSLVS